MIADFTRSDHDDSTGDHAEMLSMTEMVAAAGFIDFETEHIAFSRAAHRWSGATITHASKP